MCGLILACAGYEWSAELGAKDFDQTHWPTKKTWTEVISSLGFTPTSVSESSKLLEGHPDPYKSTSQIWLREDSMVLYIARSPYSKSESEFWIRKDIEHKDKKKLNWINLSSGISAFNGLISKLDEHKTLIKPKISRNLVDPKEIRY